MIPFMFVNSSNPSDKRFAKSANDRAGIEVSAGWPAPRKRLLVSGLVTRRTFVCLFSYWHTLQAWHNMARPGTLNRSRVTFRSLNSQRMGAGSNGAAGRRLSLSGRLTVTGAHSLHWIATRFVQLEIVIVPGHHRFTRFKQNSAKVENSKDVPVQRALALLYSQAWWKSVLTCPWKESRGNTRRTWPAIVDVLL